MLGSHPLPVFRIMSPQVATLPPGSSLKEAFQALARARQDLLVIVDQERRLLGIITKFSLYRALLAGFSLDAPLEPLIIKEVVSVCSDDDTDYLHTILDRYGISQAVVTPTRKKGWWGLWLRRTWSGVCFTGLSFSQRDGQGF